MGQGTDAEPSSTPRVRNSMGDPTAKPVSDRAARYLRHAAELREKAATETSKRSKARLMETARDYTALAHALAQFYAADHPTD